MPLLITCSFQEILAHRKSEIDEQLAWSRAAHLEVIEERENLITALETARQEQSADAQATQRKRNDLVQGLKEQLHREEAGIETFNLKEREINRVFAEKRRLSTVLFAWD